MKLSIRDQWEEQSLNEKYLEIRIGKYEACCVKKAGELTYVLQCEDGNDVYSDIGGSDYPLRTMTEKEKKDILEFAKTHLAEMEKDKKKNKEHGHKAR